MSSTNKTTNYQLSQFVGSDMPAWLGDYNTDMSKIDTAIKTASDDATDGKTQSDTNKNAIGTLANLTTTVKDNLVSAVNEVKTIADNAGTSAVGTARLTNGAVTTEKIEDGAVSVSKINFAGFKFPTPSDTVLVNLGDINSSQLFTVPRTGFLCFKSLVVGSTGNAGVKYGSSTGVNIAGICHISGLSNEANVQVGECFLVKEGDTLYFDIQGSGLLQGVTINDIQW